LVYSNCGKQISAVTIDFLDGNGYQALAAGGSISKTYNDSSSYKPFVIKAQCTDGTVYECFSIQYVEVVTVGARYAASNIKTLPVVLPATAPNTRPGTAYVVYSKLRPAGTPLYEKIVKPLIIIKGLDQSDILYSGNSKPASLDNMNLKSFLTDWDRLRDVQGYDFNAQLDDIAGYDLIYLDYHTLNGIPQNANMFITLINYINQQKALAGSSEQNVVMGIELGGLVARYGLAKMTKAGQPTGTRLLITHDAPHQGAYVPLGYQHFMHDMGNLVIGNTNYLHLTRVIQEIIQLCNFNATTSRRANATNKSNQWQCSVQSIFRHKQF
jgi:hypothetical protein